MYSIYSYNREDEKTVFNTNDFRTAEIIAYNNVAFWGYARTWVVDEETCEILKIYEHR